MASARVEYQLDDGLMAIDVADRERRRIERELHDGPQQALIGLRVRLTLLQEQLPIAGEQARLAAALDRQVELLIDDLRELARGVFPPLLASHGLVEALAGLVRAAPGPVRLRAGPLSRHLPPLESTVYFACSEALRNVAQHASEAQAVVVSVGEEGGLFFEVRDDGAGFDGQVTEGAGLALVRDRLAAAGGTLVVTSAPGRGTVVSGRLPWRPAR